jgi:ABC-type phosphate/phosphonate transport system substrate-binding protein
MSDRADPRSPRRAAVGVWLALLIAPAAMFAPQAAAQAGAAETAADEVPSAALIGTLELLVHPVYPPDQARLVYQPLVDYLNDVTELDIELVVSRNFHRYWIDARRGEAPALILEDAHMVAWRMREFDYRPLATTLNTKTFSLLTTGALADDSLVDFIGQRISSLPSPSLGYLVLANWFDNPLQQPLIESNATSWLDAVEMVFSAESDAVIAPNNLVTKYPNLYPVETSPEFPGITLTASPAVPEQVGGVLIEALSGLEENADHQAALFELDIEGFAPADADDYTGLEVWLASVFAL